MPDLHLVDATYELFRSYHAAPSRRSPDGREVGAIHGLLGTLIKLLRDGPATHVACATDHVVRSFRNELWAGYKTEEGVERDLLDQFEPAEEAMRALGLVVWPMVEFEADDALASAATRYEGSFDRIVICSPDKDLAQLVRGDRIVLLDRRREVVIDEAGVRAKWGVEPASIPDLLALVGDAADGLPGVPRWGMKSTSTVLAAVGHLDDIPDDPAAWTIAVRGAKGLAASLAAHRQAALLYRRLATLRTDVPLAEEAADLAWTGPAENWEEHCRAMGFDGLVERARAISRGAGP